MFDHGLTVSVWVFGSLDHIDIIIDLKVFKRKHQAGLGLRLRFKATLTQGAPNQTETLRPEVRGLRTHCIITWYDVAEPWRLCQDTQCRM